MAKRTRQWKVQGTGLGVAAALVGGAAGAEAAEPFGRFAAVGLTADQTMRLTVSRFHGSDFNAAKNLSKECGAVLRLYDAAGDVAAQGPIDLTGAAKSGHIELDGSTLGLAPGARAAVRGEILVQKKCAKETTGSLEIYDTATGKVEIVVPPSATLKK